MKLITNIQSPLLSEILFNQVKSFQKIKMAVAYCNNNELFNYCKQNKIKLYYYARLDTSINLNLKSLKAFLTDDISIHIKELGDFKKADVHYLIFEDMRSATPHQKGNVYKMLKRIFQLAVEEGFISKNPTTGIQVRIPAPKQKVLTANEADKLLKEAQSCNHRFYAHWTVALFTGLRNGEIYALKVSDMDLEAGIIHVSKQYTSRDSLYETKTGMSLKYGQLLSIKQCVKVR